MSETDQEQLEYGNVTCVHGMNLGTPGGADFMCGECESGFDKRVECPECGHVMFVQANEQIVSCMTSTFRRDMAKDLWLARNVRRINQTYTSTYRKLMLDVIERVRYDREIPKREHEIHEQREGFTQVGLDA